MTDFEREYKRLNAAQREAVDNIDGPMLVVAGTGTGKTQLLSLRVANILQRTDVHPYNILCLTFTESGKEAMIDRLSDFIGAVAKRVEIHTFHGFGTRLITRFPDYFPELANFRPAEDLTLYETLRTCLQNLSRSNPLSKQAYGQFTYQVDARGRISQLKRAGIPPAVALQTAETDLAWCQTTGRKLAVIFTKAGRLSPKVADSLTGELGDLLGEKPDSKLGQQCLDQLRESLQDSKLTGKATTVSNFKKQWFSNEEGKLYFKPTDQIKKLLALAELYESYEAELKIRQLYDYDDMILFALEKLKNNPEFLAQVQENFQYILADEYQDTNAAQASILNLIAGNPVHEGRPNVMVVGDDDQAIYGFQGALGDVLMDFRERWRDVKVVTLKENYRSTETILGTARTIITQGQGRLENHYQDIDKSLQARASYPNIEPTVFETGSSEAVIDMVVNSAKSASTDRQLAIIASKHKYLRELAAKLEAAKINYFYEGHEDLLTDPAMANLLLIGELIMAIKQERYGHTSYILPQVIAEGTLTIARPIAWEIALQSKTQKISWWEVMQDLPQSEVKTAVGLLKDLSATIDEKQPIASLKLVATTFSWRAIQKIQRLNTYATTYYGRDNISLGELLRYSDLCRQAGVSLEYKTVKGRQQAPVVLLSAHKSKGLEFDRVHILHADYQTWFKERGRNNNLTLPANWQAIEPLASNTDDRLRLLYVVMTRAKQELTLIKSQSSQVIPGLESINTIAYISEQLEAFSLPEEPNWRDWYLPKTSKEHALLKDLLKPTLSSYRLSPTHLTIFLDVPHGGPTTFLTGLLLGILEPVHPEAIFGSLVHRSLHFAQDKLNKTSKLPSETELEEFVTTEATNSDDIVIQDIVRVVKDYLDHSHILQPGAISEYSFSNRDIRLNDKRLTGNVDHFIVEGDKLTITDFKTGRALNSWRVTEDYYKQKLHRFRQQLLFYELLLRLSPDFDVKTLASRVSFVEPSRRDVYYDLNLDAGQAERHELESLIQAVWEKIINLDLPDISNYGLDMTGITAFEDDLTSGTI